MRGLRVSFEGGRAVEVEADENGGAIRARTDVDEGAARLGELALVDRQGRIGPLGDDLLRHAARRERRQPHRARLRLPVRGRRGGATAASTQSEIHIDFMIGGGESTSPASRGRGRGAGAARRRLADLTPPEGVVERLAELAVAFGANIRKGQIVGLTAELGGHEPLVRAIAEQAYKHGARVVDVNWFDPHVKRARIQHAVDEDCARIRAAVVRQPAARARAGGRRDHRRQRRDRAGAPRRPRPGARRARPAAGDQGVDRASSTTGR